MHDRAQLDGGSPIAPFVVAGIAVCLVVINEVSGGALVAAALAAEPYLEALLFAPVFILVGWWMWTALSMPQEK